MIKEITPSGTNLLTTAIIKQAVLDLQSAFMGYEVDNDSPDIAMKKLNDFFHSEWYQLLSDVDAGLIMKQAKINILTETIDTLTTLGKSRDLISIKVRVKDNNGKKKTKFVFHIPPCLINDYIKLFKRQAKRLKKQRDDLQFSHGDVHNYATLLED